MGGTTKCLVSNGKSYKKWMIWWYPHWWKPPNGLCWLTSQCSATLVVSLCSALEVLSFKNYARGGTLWTLSWDKIPDLPILLVNHEHCDDLAITSKAPNRNTISCGPNRPNLHHIFNLELTTTSTLDLECSSVQPPEITIRRKTTREPGQIKCHMFESCFYAKTKTKNDLMSLVSYTIHVS